MGLACGPHVFLGESGEGMQNAHAVGLPPGDGRGGSAVARGPICHLTQSPSDGACSEPLDNLRTEGPHLRTEGRSGAGQPRCHWTLFCGQRSRIRKTTGLVFASGYSPNAHSVQWQQLQVKVSVEAVMPAEGLG